MGKEKMESVAAPMLFPFEPSDFWKRIRIILREEIACMPSAIGPPAGLTNKPLYKVREVCALFQISRPTVYEWIRMGKLRPVKIRSRVFFLGSDVDGLIAAAAAGSD